MTSNKPNLVVVAKGDVLTLDQEAELIEYINYEDGEWGVKSNFGPMCDKMATKTTGIHFESDPERFIIGALDAAARNRVVHRALVAIGAHARVLHHAYLISRKPPYLDKQFGRLTGIAVHLTRDVEALVLACRRTAIGAPDASDKRLIGNTRIESQGAYNSACRAYIAARRLAAPKPHRDPAPYRAESAPHVCRVSTVYPCECGHGQD